MGIRPQDIVILLKIIAMKGRDWKQSELADELGLSRAEVSNALDRCSSVHLLDEEKRNPQKEALLDFLVHGARYVFPAKPGALGRGIPTSHSAPPLKSLIVSNVNQAEETYVWPSADGKVRGQQIEPLYITVPKAIENAPKLYEMLALVDALRVGRARELNIAKEETKEEASRVTHGKKSLN